MVETTTNATSHSEERNGQVPGEMEADQQQQADEDLNEGEARQHHHHPVLYASTKDREEEEESKDAFYNQLQTRQESTPRHEIKIVMGDLNAKSGK